MAVQYSLRSLLLLMTAAAIVFGLLPLYLRLSTDTQFLLLISIDLVLEFSFYSAFFYYRRKRAQESLESDQSV